tara:strand:+ start:641 stop:943 length:303 start_codon:yes stop_codon:yes gene_type:complete
MPKVSRKGDSLSTGHACTGTTTLATPGQSTVFAEGELVARKSDPTVSHPFPPNPPCAPHVAKVNAGSGTVFVVGKECARVNDSADAGNMKSGAGTVFAGG